METLEEDFPVTSQQMTDRRPGDSISAASDANGRLSEQHPSVILARRQREPR